MKRICIIDPIFTRYRLPVFLELSQYCRVDWIFSPSAAKAGFGTVQRPHTRGLRYVEVPTLRPFGEKTAMFQWGLVKYILRDRPDAIKVFANLHYLSFWTTLLLARLRGIPVHAHGVGFFKRRRIGPIRRVLQSLMLRLVTSYIAYAPIVRESLAAQGFPVGKVFVAHNSLINPFPVRPEEKRGTERGILFIGRLRRGCGLLLLVKVLRRLRKEHGFPLTLHVVGIGEEAQQIRQEIAGCSWVTWHGEASDMQVSTISRDCFLGCYPGNAGLSVVHMMSLSLPVVIHNDLPSHEGPEPSYVRDGISGVLYDHSCPEESLYRILRSISTDPSHVAQMQRSAFEDYQSLVNPSYAERLWSILNEESAASARSLSIAHP
jgi:glycosyltransferase involved in cell wall biosynthesis